LLLLLPTFAHEQQYASQLSKADELLKSICKFVFVCSGCISRFESSAVVIYRFVVKYYLHDMILCTRPHSPVAGCKPLLSTQLCPVLLSLFFLSCKPTVHISFSKSLFLMFSDLCLSVPLAL